MLRAARVQTLGRTRKPDLPEREPVSTPVVDALRSRRPAFFGGRFVGRFWRGRNNVYSRRRGV